MNLNKKILTLAGVLSFFTLFRIDSPNLFPEKQKENILEKRCLESYDPLLDKFVLLPNVPKYNLGKGSDCSAYVRLAAYDLFSREYSWSHAWERRKKDKLVGTLNLAKEYSSSGGIKFFKKYKMLDSTDFWDSYLELDSLEKEGVLERGMLVGVYNRRPDISKGEKELWSGKPALYTHVILYVGRDEFGKMVFFEEWNNRQGETDFKKMYENRVLPMEILEDDPVRYAKR